MSVRRPGRLLATSAQAKDWLDDLSMCMGWNKAQQPPRRTRRAADLILDVPTTHLTLDLDRGLTIDAVLLSVFRVSGYTTAASQFIL